MQGEVHIFNDLAKYHKKHSKEIGIQPKIEAYNRFLVLYNQSLVLNIQSLVLYLQSLVLNNQSLVLNNQSEVLNNQSLVLNIQSEILNIQSLVLYIQFLVLKKILESISLEKRRGFEVAEITFCTKRDSDEVNNLLKKNNIICTH